MEEAEAVIRKVLEELADPELGGATCTPAFLLSRTKSSLDVIDSVTDSFSVYNNDPSCKLIRDTCNADPLTLDDSGTCSCNPHIIYGERDCDEVGSLTLSFT